MKSKHSNLLTLAPNLKQNVVYQAQYRPAKSAQLTTVFKTEPPPEVTRPGSPPDPKTKWLITVYYKNDLFKSMQEQYYHLVQQKYERRNEIKLRFCSDFIAGKVSLKNRFFF